MKFRSVPGVILTSICDEYYLIKSSRRIQINESAAFIWNLLSDGISEDDLVKQVINQYEVPDEKSLISDIHDLISLLEDYHMIMKCGA